MKYSIVGVIGHIDHGKTSLVAALTGRDTDTHPEEKRRGITIDLGFASFAAGDHQFALIDAPGHQKYIGNLLAGVSSIDVALLVVAADQGIQAQTLEHASIVQSLGVKRLIVALSRTDLAPPEAVDELREELDVFLADFGYADVPMVPVSVVTQTGLEDLKTQLCAAAGHLPLRSENRLFRMPIDRVFTIAGRGCVIAGTVWGGTVRPGDNLQIISGDRVFPVRVRDLEVHGQAVDQSKIGYRTAMNVAGVSAHDVARGDELVQPNAFLPTRHFLAEISVFSQIPEIKCPATMQLHLAATACSVRVTGVRRLVPGQSAVVALESERPVIGTFGQKCLLRLPYPVGTVAGGTVLASLDSASRRRRRLIEFGERIALADPVDRLVAWTDFLGELNPKAQWCETACGIGADDVPAVVAQAVETGQILELTNNRLVSVASRAVIQDRILNLLTQQTAETQDAWCIEDSLIRQAETSASPEFVRATIDHMVEKGTLVRLGRMVAIASDDTTLSKKQTARMERILEMYRDQKTPPTLKEVAAELEQPIEKVRSLARFAVQAGLLLDIGQDLLLSAAVFQQLCRELQDLFASKDELSVAEIRDHWQVTRKHAVPFLEYCDRTQATIRRENVRVAGPNLPKLAAATTAASNDG